MQQAEVIRERTGYQVGHYCGEMGQDFWDARRWQREFETKQVAFWLFSFCWNDCSVQYFGFTYHVLMTFQNFIILTSSYRDLACSSSAIIIVYWQYTCSDTMKIKLVTNMHMRGYIYDLLQSVHKFSGIACFSVQRMHAFMSCKQTRKNSPPKKKGHACTFSGQLNVRQQKTSLYLFLGDPLVKITIQHVWNHMSMLLYVRSNAKQVGPEIKSIHHLPSYSECRVQFSLLYDTNSLLFSICQCSLVR